MSSAFPVSTGNFPCGVNGAGLTSQASCNSYATNSTIRASGLNLTTNNIGAMSFSINVTMTMSQTVSPYTLTVNTLSTGSVVDSGTVALTTKTRQLSSSQFTVSSSSSLTYSPTTYTITVALPFDPGFAWNLDITIPVDLQSGFTQPSIANTDVISYTKPTIVAIRPGLTNTTMVVTGMMTPLSTAPFTISLNISNNGSLMFTGSQVLTMSGVRTITTLTGTQSNQIVYAGFVATLTVSDLFVGDNVRLSTNFNTYFYGTTQNNCSTSVVNCQTNGLLTVLSTNNSGTGLTTFSVNLVNQAHMGSYTLTVDVYDQANLYQKQTGTISMQVTILNNVIITPNQTNPYLN